jgi:prevent-host-death family protein
MRELSPNEKGAVAELAIATAAARLGVGVYKPLSEHSRADLVFEIGDRLWRIQCKWAQLNEDSTTIAIRTSGSRLSPRGYIRTTYGQHEIDFLAAYCDGVDRCFLVPAEQFADRHTLLLRLTSPRNNQVACINLAEHFAFEGAIAQLGERCHGMAEVVGSSPTSSTSSDQTPLSVGSNPFRDRLGYWMDRVAAGEEVIITRRGKPRFRMSPV